MSRPLTFSFLVSALLSLILPAGLTCWAQDAGPRAEKSGAAAEVTELSGIAYRPDPGAKPDLSKNERCQLDLRLPAEPAKPAEGKGFATLIWFHGGGLTGGSRRFPAIEDPSIALVAAGYRLSPEAILPDIIDDAATAVAWTFQHIAEYGGDPDKIFISGASAGGYLTAMLGMDARWLEAKGLSHQRFAGIIPVSAQMTTHFHVKKLRGDKGEALRPLIDEFAPLYHASKNLPPICLITGDRQIEYKSRVEENDLMAVTLRNLQHPLTEFHEVPGENHGSISKAAVPYIEAFIKRVLAGEDGAVK